MEQPIIGIAGNHLLQGAEVFSGHAVSYTPQGFVDGITEAGGLPLILPISSSSMAATYINQIDKLLLAGGQDVSPEFYHEEPIPALKMVDPDRDRFEMALIQEAIRQQKPILGVCRGMQLLNVALGGSLYQDLSHYPGWQVKHEQQPTPAQFATHKVTINPDSLLGGFLPDDYQVNSFHHQGVKELADAFTSIATASDGLIEGIESQKLRILGVQWHPELTRQKSSDEQAIFDFLVQTL